MKRIASVLVAVALIGCGGKEVVKDSGPEIFLPGEFIEAVDADTILVKCQGQGADQNAAILTARKGCVDWLINSQLAQTAEEKQSYLAVQKQIMGQIDKYVNIPGAGSSDGKGEGVKSRTRVDDNTVRVAIIVKVSKKTLSDDLMTMGVVKSKDTMLEGVGMPTMMVVPSKANKGSKDREVMKGLVASYLTKARYEVLDQSAVEDLNKLVGAIGEVEGAEEDEAAALAQAIGADIYVTFEANKKAAEATASQAYSVTIKAFETTTARLLGSDTALSAPRTTWVAGEEVAAFSEALNDCMAKLLPQVTAYWKEDAPKGNRFKIVIKNAPKNADMKLNTTLKKVCAFVKTNATKKTVEFYAQCKGDTMEVAGALAEGMDNGLSGNEYEFVSKKGNSIIVVFK